MRLPAGLALPLLLVGCSGAIAAIERTNRDYERPANVAALWTGAPDGRAAEVLARNCPRSLDESRCTDVTVPGDPEDVEFWRFTLLLAGRITVSGLPVSPAYPGAAGSIWYGVIGPRERCEAIRLTMDAKPKGVAGDETTHMTEPCAGPFYLKRP